MARRSIGREFKREAIRLVTFVLLQWRPISEDHAAVTAATLTLYSNECTDQSFLLIALLA